MFFLKESGHHPILHSFPTRRSSDLSSTASAMPRAYKAMALAESSLPGMMCSTPSGEWLVSTTATTGIRSEEHMSELQSRPHLVCRLLLEKKNIIQTKRGSSRRYTHD